MYYSSEGEHCILTGLSAPSEQHEQAAPKRKFVTWKKKSGNPNPVPGYSCIDKYEYYVTIAIVPWKFRGLGSRACDRARARSMTNRRNETQPLKGSNLDYNTSKGGHPHTPVDNQSSP